MAEPKITGAMRIVDGSTDLRTLKELNTLLTTLNTNVTNLTNLVNNLKPKQLYYNTTGGTNVTLSETSANYNWFIVEWGCNGHSEYRTDILFNDGGTTKGRLLFYVYNTYHVSVEISLSGTKATLGELEVAGWSSNVARIFKVVGFKIPA